MERKQETRSRAKSPARTASPMSNLLRRRRKNYSHHPEPFFFRSGGLRPAEALSPLKEGPDPDGTDAENSRIEGRWAQWMKGQLARGGPSVSTSTCKRSDLRLLLGVLGAPLAPVHVSALDSFPHLTIKDTPIVSPQPHPFFSLSFFPDAAFIYFCSESKSCAEIFYVGFGFSFHLMTMGF